MIPGEETYLGDSVYVKVDGGQLVLKTDNGYGASNTIYLERDTYNALVKFVAASAEVF